MESRIHGDVYVRFGGERLETYRPKGRQGALRLACGGGKTLIMCCGAYEKKRLGLANKPMIIGLKANIHEIARTFCTAYPMAKVHPYRVLLAVIQIVYSQPLEVEVGEILVRPVVLRAHVTVESTVIEVCQAVFEVGRLLAQPEGRDMDGQTARRRDNRPRGGRRKDPHHVLRGLREETPRTGQQTHDFRAESQHP